MLNDEIVTEYELTSAGVDTLREFCTLLIGRTRTEFPYEHRDSLAEYFNSIENSRAVVVVSKLGPIRDQQLLLRTSLYAPDPAHSDPYDPVGEIARWYPDFATGNYVNKLGLAHERKNRQLQEFFKERGGGITTKSSGQ